MKLTLKQSVLYVGLVATLIAVAWTHEQKQQDEDLAAVELLADSITTGSMTKKTKSDQPKFVLPTRTETHSKTISTSTADKNIDSSDVRSHVSVDLFKSHQWQQPVQEVSKPVENLLPESPPIPALPFVYLGKFEDKTEAVVYLMDGDMLLTVSKGEVIDDNYRLDAISDNSLVLTYLPQNVRQTLNIKRNS